MEPRQLREFLAILECGSLSDAARRLGILQPNLTKSLQSLERTIGGALFIRTKLGMKATALGLSLEPRARVILREIDRADQEIAEIVNGTQGRVVVGTGPSFANAILPRAIARFRARHPRIETVVIDGLYPQLVPKVKNGELDFACCNGTALADGELAGESLLANEPTVIVTRAQNPLTRKRNITIQQISTEPWLLPVKLEPLRRQFENVFVKAHLPVPTPVLECPSYFLVKEILHENDILTLFNRLMVQDEIERGVLKTIAVPEFEWPLDYHAIYRRDVPMTRAAQMFLAEIQAVCNDYRKRVKNLAPRPRQR